MDNKLQRQFRQYLDGTLTKNEFYEFIALLAQKDKSSISAELFSLWEDSKSKKFSLPAEEWDEKMKCLIEETEKFRPKKSRNLFQYNLSRSLFWGRGVAAIFVLILIAGAILFINRQLVRDVNPLISVEQSSNDILPGGNRGVLTLGDGSQIILDNANNGILAQQGNAKIVKLENGKLAYDIVSNENIQILSNKIATPRGGQFFVALPDGTSAWLNAASSIKFPSTFTGSERKVEITGEVYFEVANNEGIPFIVKTGDAEVKVVGTHFNVNAYEDEDVMKITLLEGRIEVSTSHTSSVSLIPGQQVSLSKTDKLDVLNVDPMNAVSWKNGYFQFDHADIQTVMRQLSRWYDVEVIYESVMPSQLFGGEMQRNLTLSQILNILGKSQVKFRIEGRKIIVM